MRKEFRFSLQHPDGRFYAVVNKAVQLTATEFYIKDPVDWSTIDIRFRRHTRFYGVQRVVAVPVKFAVEGAAILRHLYLTQGVEAPCIFVAERKRQAREDYEVFFSNPVDFSQTIITDLLTQVSILDNGLENLLQNKGDTTYETSILNSDSLRILADGVKLKNKSVFSATSSMQAGGVNARQYSPDMVNTFNEAPYLNDIKLSRTLDTNVPASMIDTSFIYKASHAGAVTVSYKGTVNAQLITPAVANNTFAVVAYLKSGSTVTPIDIYIGTNYNNTVANFTETVPLTSKTFNVAPGDLVMLVIGTKTFAASATGRWAFDSTDGEFTIEYFLRQPATEVRAYRQFQVWQKHVIAMAGAQYGVVSNYLNSTLPAYADMAPAHVAITCGDSVRGFTDEFKVGPLPVGIIPPKIKTTFNQLFRDLNGRDFVGIGVEGNNVRIEQAGYFFDDSTDVIDSLGAVKDLKISVATDYIFNQLKIGYKYRESDTLNGKDDPHTTSTWAAGITRVKNDLDLVSEYIASMYTWEYVRGNLSKKSTTDSSNDNDIFLAELSGQINAAGQWLLARRQNDPGNSVTGLVAEETAFNLGLLPKRNLFRNGPRIRTGLHLQESSMLTFQSIEQNSKVTTRLSALGVLVEALSEQISRFGAPPFLPIFMEFTAPIPRDFMARMRDKPYGRIPFLDRRGNALAGFAHEIVVKPGTKEASNWKLLCSPSVDLSKLV